ncbi:hypothetical protein [Vibrio campbellii]|uniref:hypothetical protein n=1 Tax=Vibrio campbellii TaxID=680 RepID=UPI00249CACAF|nr:hypothetical protein [Vibrio campbellii]
MAVTFDSMKKNLVDARRSASVPINVSHINRCLAQGISKKAVCSFYGISYQQLKAVRHARD